MKENAMALHRLTSITLGVPDVDAAAGYYEEFGLTPVGDGTVHRFATRDGGEQLRLARSAQRRLIELGIGVEDQDDLDRAAVSLAGFPRCSTDHHNVLVQRAPVDFLHHTAREVDDVDEVGRGATAMLEGHPERHVWGLGRHHIGSNFFWYLKDPAGNFSEYYSDLDTILDDQLWKPAVVDGARGIYNWGPPLPPSFIEPEDLAALMTGSHSSR
jgi:catechol-2,3-dioxygenase